MTTNPIKIIINLSGGLVQDVGCSDPNAKVIVVDWDCNDHDCGIVISTLNGCQESAWVSEVNACGLSAFRETAVGAAIRAYRDKTQSSPS